MAIKRFEELAKIHGIELEKRSSQTDKVDHSIISFFGFDHTEYVEYQCRCSARFAVASGLKPYTCPVCGQTQDFIEIYKLKEEL